MEDVHMLVLVVIPVSVSRFGDSGVTSLTSCFSGFGGWGFASRMWGMTLDNVLSATVVLANGSIVIASEDSNPELYWVSTRWFCAPLNITDDVCNREFEGLRRHLEL